MKISIVRHGAPSDLRQHLMLTTKDYGGDYEIFRQKIDGHWRETGPQSGEDFVEEVDYVE